MPIYCLVEMLAAEMVRLLWGRSGSLPRNPRSPHPGLSIFGGTHSRMSKRVGSITWGRRRRLQVDFL